MKIDLSYLTHPQRLESLERTHLMDSLPEPAFDRFVRLAARLTRSPTALVSLVDQRRQFFKAFVGLGEPWASQRETPLSHSFCQYVVASGEPLWVDDARKHELVKDNLAIEELGVEAYLGTPLSIEGHRVGSLCVIDSRPRHWEQDELLALQDLAEVVNTEMQLRLQAKQLIESRNFAEGLANAIPALVYVYDYVQGKMLYLNGYGRQLLDLKQEDLAGVDLDHVHPEDREQLERRRQRQLESDGPHEAEFRVRFPNGEYRWVQNRLVILARQADGSPAQGLGVASDLQRLKQNEAELKAANKAKGEFLARASHELRTPLHGILGATEMALRQEDVVGRTEELVHAAHRSARSLLAIVDELLQIHQLDVGANPLKREAFSLPERMSDLESQFVANAERLRFAPVPAVTVDEDWGKIRQILVNLVGNALKFSHGLVFVDVRQEQDRLVFDVRDEGRGIPEEDSERIFQPFERLAHSAGVSGTGLGLPIARKLAELMEGTLTVSGSTFRLSLPFRPATELVPAEPVTPSAPPRLKVLVVDDHELNLELFEMMLESLGQEVMLASSGPEALEKAANHAFDLVLLDLQMPEMDGFEVLQRLPRELRVIAMSADAMAETRQRCVAAGFAGTLPKPVSREELAKVLCEGRPSESR